MQLVTEPLSLQCYRECPTPVSALNQHGGELRECGLPPPVTAAQGPSHSHPEHGTRLANLKMACCTGTWGVTPAVPFLNLDRIACLVGQSNEALITVDGQKVTTLIDSGEQVSSVSSGFCKWMTLKVHPLDRLLELEGTGGSAIPYLGFVEVNLQIHSIGATTRMSCCLSYWPWPILRRYWSWWDPKLLTGWWEWSQRGIS